MSLLIIYFIKLSVCLAIVYLFYQLVLRKLTFYNSNRWYLAGYTFLSFFIPLINITPLLEKNSFSNNKIVQFIPTMDESGLVMNDNMSARSNSIFSTWGLEEWLLVVLVTGATIFLIRFILRFISFYRMRQDAHLVFNKGMKLYQVNDNIIPFSFGNSVFINSELHTEEEMREIIRHEYVHVKQKHSIDIIWSEWLCIVNWYNPFAWLLRSSMRQNLEFIADHKVLEKGLDRKQYQYLLLKVIGNNHFSIAQKFNFSSLKKRIAMMNTLRSAKLHLARFLFILPLLAVILISFRKKQQESKKPAVAQYEKVVTTDTIPPEVEPNDKGYIIYITRDNGSSFVVINDKGGKQVERIPVSKWKERETFYEEKYGEIPYPAPPPAPPSPAVPPPPTELKLPANVKRMEFGNERVEVWLNDGKKETYNLKVSDEKKAFKSKYGEMSYPPEPPAAPEPTAVPVPALPKLPQKVSGIHVNNNRAEVWFKDGNEEVYDLKIPAQKEAFEKKYGNSPVIADTPAPPGVPKTIRLIKPGEGDKVAELCDEFEIKDMKAVMHLKNGKTEEYDLNDVNSRRNFEEKFGKIMDVNLSVTVAPVAIASNPTGVTVVSASAPAEIAAPVLAIGESGETISGEEEILVTISKKTTPQQLQDFKSNMKERGIELNYDHTDFKEGVLVNISGTIKLKDNAARFSATDFNKLILSTVTNGERISFKVKVSERNKVI